jgi:ATP-binding cassette, subfamily B, bacterial MsbA
MQVYLRIFSYIWPFRRLFVLSMICAFVVSLFWAVNLSVAFPIVKVLFENDSIHGYVEDQIASTQGDIQREQAYVDSLDPGQVDHLATAQSRLSTASRSLALSIWARDNVLPWIPTDKFDTIVAILVLLLVATILKGVFIYIQELLVGSVVQLTVNSIRQDCFRSALRLDYQTLNGIGSASLMSRMTNDIEQMTATIRVIGVSMIREPLKASGCILVAFLINWRLTLLTVTVVPLLGLMFHRFGKLLREASHRSMQSMAHIYDCISETFNASKIVIAFSGYRRHRKQFLTANRVFYDDSMRIVRLGSLIRPITEIMAVIALFAALGPGAYLVLRNTNEIWGIQLAMHPMEIAELTTLYALLLGTLDPVRKLSGVFTQIKRGMAGSERVFHLVDMRTAVPEPKPARVLARHASRISFQNVSFRYSVGDDPNEHERPLALRNVSLDIPFGEVVAVVGGNGSGKSTLVNMIPRFVDPSGGHVRIDSVDIREYRTLDLRSQIGLVTQETLLFNDSIYENIRYGNSTATREQIEDAAKQAHADSFISQLPDGYDTVVGDKGSKLSGGQRQRISLARAIVRDPAILILDEATSAVDAQSEELIHKVLKDFARNRTVFIISHVLNRTFLDLVTRIVVMDQGKIVGIGQHDELLKTCPIYCGLTAGSMANSGREAA